MFFLQICPVNSFTVFCEDFYNTVNFRGFLSLYKNNGRVNQNIQIKTNCGWRTVLNSTLCIIQNIQNILLILVVKSTVLAFEGPLKSLKFLYRNLSVLSHAGRWIFNCLEILHLWQQRCLVGCSFSALYFPLGVSLYLIPSLRWIVLFSQFRAM